MKIKIILGIFVLILMACFSIEGPKEPVWIEFRIDGVVTYSDTHEPVVDCSIELWKNPAEFFPPISDIYWTNTDEDGRYRIRHKYNKRDGVWGSFVLNVYIDGKLRGGTLQMGDVIEETDEFQIINIEIDPL